MAKSLGVTSFAGSTPRRADHLVPNGQAAFALDCRLENGLLESWRNPRPIMTVNAGTKSLYQAFNCCWLESSTCASFAEGPVELRHVFATGYNGSAYPVRITFDDMCNPQVTRLGLPCPNTAPSVTAAEVSSKAAGPRQYAYQFEDSFGNRSAISMPSNMVIMEDGEAAMVSGWEVPAGNWDIAKIVLYRSTPGYDSPVRETQNTVDAAWMEVTELPATATSYTDIAWNVDLYDALREDIVLPPPANLQGMVWVKSMNCLAGFVGRDLYFSVNNEYHNWSIKHTLDDTIKEIVESNDIVYVATDGAPYVVKAAVDVKAADTRSILRMPESVPLVGSGNRSMTAIPGGAVYPTHTGLVIMSGASTPKILTSAHYGPEDWEKLHPNTAVIGYHAGRLYCFFRNGGFCMVLKDGAGTGTELDHHTELSIRPNEVVVTRAGRLFMRVGTEVVEWNRGTGLMPHRYEGAELLSGVPVNFGAAQIIMKTGLSEQVQLFCDGDLALDEQAFRTEDWPLPMWATGQVFRWVLSGTGTVKAFTIAPSSKEL